MCGSAQGVEMKKFNAFSVYRLGKDLFPLFGMDRDKYKFKEVFFPLWAAREAVLAQLGEESIFLEASKRAASDVIRYIDDVVPRDFGEAIKIDAATEIPAWKIRWIKDAVQTLETVLTNDMPGLSSYMVGRKGIYSTEDLIERADNHFHEEVKAVMPPRAKEDFREAGKCLAYEVPTACAFHLWRAVETVTDAYYAKLAGKTFEQAGVPRNWFQYIKALQKAKADVKITEFLDMIRDKYRNPQMHPEEMVTVPQAFGLFGAAASAISQIVLEMNNCVTAVTPQLESAAPAIPAPSAANSEQKAATL
jgi:hypothetical protein